MKQTTSGYSHHSGSATGGEARISWDHKRYGATQLQSVVGRLQFLISGDADPLWQCFFFALADTFERAYGLTSEWTYLSSPSLAANASEKGLKDLLAQRPSEVIPSTFRAVMHWLRTKRPSVVHTVGWKAAALGQSVRLFAYPSPSLLCVPGSMEVLPSGAERWLDRFTRTLADRHLVADHHDRLQLLRSGFPAEKTVAMPLATRAQHSSATPPLPGVRDEHFVLTAAFCSAGDDDRQWLALEILAEMVHRGVPSFLIAATTSSEAAAAVEDRARRLDVAQCLVCRPLLPDTHAIVAHADVALLPSSSAFASWFALAAVDAGTPVVKSPTVRIPRVIQDLFASAETIHPLARDDLHTWVDTMEDFRPRRSHPTTRRVRPAPALPALEDVARDYIRLYRVLRSRSMRRR